MSSFVPGWFRWLPLLGVACLVPGTQAQQPATKPVVKPATESRGIFFIEPSSATTDSTNITDTISSPSSRNVLKEGIRKPFELSNPTDSLSGTRAPQNHRTQSPAEARRMKAALDRKKNWIFLPPEEIYRSERPEQVLGAPEFGPDGEPLEPETALEGFLGRMEKGRNAASSNLVHKASGPDADADANDASAGKRREENPLLSFLAPQNGQPPVNGLSAPLFNRSIMDPSGSPDNGTGSTFGIAATPSANDPFVKNPVREANMEQFKQLIGIQTPSPAFDAGSAFRPPTTLAPAPALAAPKPASVAPALTPVLTPSTPTFGSALPTVATPFALPVTQPVKSRYLPPTYEAPKRKF